MKKIAIHGVPRSGTSWLGTIFDSSPYVAYRHQPLFSYTHKSALNENSSKIEINSFFNSIYKTSDSFVLQEGPKKKGLVPSFRKSHIKFCIYKEARYHNILSNLMKQSDDIVVIAIIRNPLSVLASWKNAPKEFLSSWNFSDEWHLANKKNQDKPEEFYGFKKWLEACKIFELLQIAYPDRFKIIKYNDLITDTISSTTDLFKFCNIPWNKQTFEYLTESPKIDKSESVYSVYRSNPSDQKWEKELLPEIVNEVISTLKEEGLSSYI